MLLLKIEDLKDLAEYSVRQSVANGASYAEARIQATSAKGAIMSNGEVQPAVMSESFGLAVRVICRGALGFAATNLLDLNSVKELSERAVKMARSAAIILKKPISLDNSKASRKKWYAEEKESIEGATPNYMKSILDEVEGRIGDGKLGIKIPNRYLALSTSLEQKYFVNSDGARVESRVPRLHFFAILTAIENGEVAQRTIQQAESGGLEVLRRIDIVKKVEDEGRILGDIIRRAGKAPEGILDVILSPELSGIAAHESVGHPQEADRVIGREGAQAGESYIKRHDLGKRIGSEEANVSDDPTIPHSNGFHLVDDEGVEAKKRLLIKEGVINEFLHNRATAAEFGLASNGAARASAFNREPIIRMSNTFVEPGDYEFDELLKEVRLGVYFKTFTEWNIDDKRVNQRYVGLEAYLIEGGEMKGLVRSPVLEITTGKLWSSVKARSKRLEFEAATCGKGDPMQGIPVWTGGPDTLLKGVRVTTR